MKIQVIVIVCWAALLIAAAVAVVVASRNRQQPAPPPDVPVAQTPAEVRVKAVERNPVAIATAAFLNKTTSSAGNCGIIFSNESNAKNMVPDPTSPAILLGFAGSDPRFSEVPLV